MNTNKETETKPCITHNGRCMLSLLKNKIMKKIKAILTHIKGSPVTSSKEQCNIHDVVRSSQKKNPYKLVWYNQDWSQKRTDQNNIRYWKWEQEHNGLKLP